MLMIIASVDLLHKHVINLTFLFDFSLQNVVIHRAQAEIKLLGWEFWSTTTNERPQIIWFGWYLLLSRGVRNHLMDVDPTADIREIWILLLQLFHETGGDRQNASHTHTHTRLNSIAVFIYMRSLTLLWWWAFGFQWNASSLILSLKQYVKVWTHLVQQEWFSKKKHVLISDHSYSDLPFQFPCSKAAPCTFVLLSQWII